MGRSPCCDKVGLRKGTWTPEEDQKLLSYIEQHGHGSWRALPPKAGLQRCGKSCRLRWTNYLRPDIKRGKFTLQEEQTIIQLHALLGNRWSAIATHLPKRTDNEIKNYWNTHLKKRLSKMGIDPSTHKPKMNPLGSALDNKDTANLSHMAQWESARLEAESRLVRESKLINIMSATATPPPPVSVTVTPHPHHHRHLGPTLTPLLVHHQSLLNKTCNKLSPQSDPLLVLPCLDVLKAWQGIWKTNNGFFNPGGTLQSPTSTLHFSDHVFAALTTSSTAAACFGDNLAFSDPNNNNNDNTCLQTSNDHDVLIDYPIDHAAYFDDESLRSPSFMEGFVDGGSFQGNLLHHHGSSAGSGDLEDNKKYWNHILMNVEINPTSSESNLHLTTNP